MVRNDQWLATVGAGQCTTSVFGTHFESLSAATVESNSALLAILAQVSPIPDLLSDLRNLTDQNRRFVRLCHVAVRADPHGQFAGILQCDFCQDKNGYLGVALFESVADFKSGFTREQQLHDHEIGFVHL